MNIEEKKGILKEIRRGFHSGEYRRAFLKLNEISSPEDDFVRQVKYASLIKAVPQGVLELKKIRLAILATSTVSHFNGVLKYWLAKEGLDAQIYEGEYNTLHQTVLDSGSGLYEFNPDIVMIFTNHRDIKFKISFGASAEEIQEAVASSVDDFVALWKVLQENSNCFIIQNNADLPINGVFGNYEGTALWADLNILRNFNLELSKAVFPGVVIFDLDYISSVYGKKNWHDARYWYHSKHAFDMDAIGMVAYQASKTIGSIKGYSKKCLVLDLDNTLWGGVIGDDGIEGIKLGNGPEGEAFVDFQKYLLQLKNRGIILAVCSKNEEDLAKEPFLNHPDMRIKLEDIVIFKANWEDKASNIKDIAASLNIGLDSIVFLDDNPAERELVRNFLPMVSTPELPLDPAGYISAVSSQSFFETVTFSQEDKVRSNYYRDNIKRYGFQEQFTNLSEYLQNLRMEIKVGEFDDFNLPRIAQLINKSNQFHLTTTRYSQTEVKAMRMDKNRYCRYFKMKDCFGDNGLISVIILKKQEDGALFIDTWVMSCRVLSRGVEEFICREIISIAQEAKCEKIIGKYIPTKKNKLASELYKRLCFEKVREIEGTTFWEFKLAENIPVFKTFIKKVELESKVGG
jgi:FkbH-like protein